MPQAKTICTLDPLPNTALGSLLPPHWEAGMGCPEVCVCTGGGPTVQRGQVQHEVGVWAWLLPEAGVKPAGWQGPLPVHPPWQTGHLPTVLLWANVQQLHHAGQPPGHPA